MTYRGLLSLFFLGFAGLTAADMPAPKWEQRVPFAFKVTTPEFSAANWWQFLGVGLNVLAGPRYTPKGQFVHETNQWYLAGKGTPLLESKLGNPLEINVPYGIVTVESTQNPRALLTQDPNKLVLSYRLSLPISRSAGSAYLIVSGNAPMPAITEGESLRLSVWARAELTQARSQGLAYVGYANTFGGDIFTEYPPRLGLSYQKEAGTYAIPEYDVKAGQTTLRYGPHRTDEMRKVYASHQRVHSADSPRGLASRNGFVLSPVWSEVATQRFTVNRWDIGTNVASFELWFQLPYATHSALSSAVLWENVTGMIELSGFRWFKEVPPSP